MNLRVLFILLFLHALPAAGQVRPDGDPAKNSKARSYDFKELTRPLKSEPGVFQDLYRAFGRRTIRKLSHRGIRSEASALPRLEFRDAARAVLSGLGPDRVRRIAADSRRPRPELVLEADDATHGKLKRRLAALNEAHSRNIVIKAMFLRLPAPECPSPGSILSEEALSVLLSPKPSFPESVVLTVRSGGVVHGTTGRETAFPGPFKRGAGIRVRQGGVVEVQPLWAHASKVALLLRAFHGGDGGESYPFLEVETALTLPLGKPVFVCAGTTRREENESQVLGLVLRAKAGTPTQGGRKSESFNPGISALLSSVTMAPDFEDRPLPDVLAVLSRRVGVRVFWDPGNLQDPAPRVTLSMGETSVGTILRVLARILDLKVMHKTQAIALSPARGVDEADSKPRVYSIAGLLLPALWAARRDLGAPYGLLTRQEEPFPDQTRSAVFELERMGTWVEGCLDGGAAVRRVGPYLMVLGPKGLHHSVNACLERLGAVSLAPVRVSGAYLKLREEDLPPGARTPGMLSEKMCDALEKDLRSEPRALVLAFGCQGTVGTRLWISGGAQELCVRQDGARPGKVQPVHRGWTATVKVNALPGTAQKSVDVAALLTPGRTPGERQRLRTRVTCPPRGGVLLGGSGGEGGTLLFLRLR